jgi:hypothetical protein
MREDRAEERSDVRAREVIDVLVPGTVEAAAEHKPCIVVEEHESGFVQGAYFANGIGSTGILNSSIDGFSHRLSVARLDVREDGKLRPDPGVQSWSQWVVHG